MNKLNPKIPILMYHEISSNLYVSSLAHQMTPMYDIPAPMFERQICMLSEKGYKSLLFEDVQNIKEDRKYVIITFDDGLKGNYRFALPVLKKYGFKAVFFINVGAIDSERFMSWDELAELVSEGMSIQSHTVSHKPLETLNDQEIYNELLLSKQVIEERLRTNVSALSFPHGSYNLRIVRLAQQVGYKFMGTSDIQRVYYNSFKSAPVVLGRIAMTKKMSLNNLIKIVEFNQSAMIKHKLAKSTKNLFKRIVGIDNYRRLYRKFFNIKLSYNQQMNEEQVRDEE